MSERPNGFPSDEEIGDFLGHLWDLTPANEPDEFTPISKLQEFITHAVEQAVAEQANLADTWRKKASDMATRHAVDLERARLEAKIEAIKEWGSHSHKEWDHYKWESCVLCRETQQLQQQIAALKEKP